MACHTFMCSNAEVKIIIVLLPPNNPGLWRSAHNYQPLILNCCFIYIFNDQKIHFSPNNYIPENLKISVILCFWLRRRLRRRHTPTLVQAITLSQIHLLNSYSPYSHWGPRLQEPYDFCHQSEKAKWPLATILYKNAQKACGISNCVTNSPIHFIFGIAIDNT